MEKSYMNAKSDEEIVLMAQNGDDSALEYILEKYKRLVKARARGYFLAGADREDVIQEGMIGLYKAVRDFDKEKNVRFSSFADLCAVRQIVSAVKASTRQKHMPLNTYVSLSSPVYDESDKVMLDVVYGAVEDPVQIVINEESYKNTQSVILSTLSKFEQAVLVEYLSGKSYQSIAEKFSKTTKSIDNALQRIKRKLEVQLKI